MQKIVPIIKNGSRELVVSESFVARKNEKIYIDIPVGDSAELVKFEFDFVISAGNPARWDANYLNQTFHYKLTNFNGGNIDPSNITIAGYSYQVHFFGTVFGENVLFTFSMYQVGKAV
ncbi:hypothetical protein ACNH6C_05050 [Bdellovibrio bacteriovorus]|uniref:hypothetical protein n=1 Tax=Bdellovibrio bacteriovorus TaxID=959 RepID=UPI003A7FB096